MFFSFLWWTKCCQTSIEGLNVYKDPPSYLHVLWDVVAKKKKTEQKKLFVWVNPPRPFPFAIGRESSQWGGGEVDFLWANYTGPTCKIFLTSPMVFILKRKKRKRSPSLRKTLSLCMWYLDACLVFVLLCRDWWRGFRFSPTKQALHMSLVWSMHVCSDVDKTSAQGHAISFSPHVSNRSCRQW